MPTCQIFVTRNDKAIYDCKGNLSEALDFIYSNEMCDSSTYVRIITNGNFVRDFWWGDFTRPQDYVVNEEAAYYSELERGYAQDRI